MVHEQEAQSVQVRLDEIRAGDVIVLHDVKLKGRKGLTSYTQQAGSVQEPLFAICVETEGKKNKIKVWQVEKGKPEHESYRLDDLQSGLIRVRKEAGQKVLEY